MNDGRKEMNISFLENYF